MDRENFTTTKTVEAYTAGALSDGANTGNSIDTQFYNSLTAVFSFSVTAGQVDSILWEQSEDNGVSDPWTAVPTQENLYYPGSFPLTATGILTAGTVAKKRYVRPVITTSDTPTISVVFGVAMLQDSLTKPMAKEASVLADTEVISPSATGDAKTTPPKRT